MVAYDVTPDQTGNYSLIEREEKYLGVNLDQSSPVDQEEAGITAIFENLSSFMFEYFDPGDNANPARWVKEWDGKTARRLPAAISMTMMARNSRGDSLSRHMVVPIQAKPSDPRLNFVNPFNQVPSVIIGQ